MHDLIIIMITLIINWWTIIIVFFSEISCEEKWYDSFRDVTKQTVLARDAWLLRAIFMGLWGDLE